MSSNSSVSNSEFEWSIAGSRRDLLLRLSWFLAPLLLISLLVAAIAIASGELLPVSIIARLQIHGRPFIYLTQFSDHNYRLKIDAARLLKPDVLIMGASRSNQWRSAMFKPLTFYNAGNCIYALRDYRRMLEDLGAYTPRVIIFSVDFYTFNRTWEQHYANVSHDDIGSLASAEMIGISRQLLKQAASDPRGLSLNPREPLYGKPALGLTATRLGAGFRLDGSYQYGPQILANASIDVDGAIGRVTRGEEPFEAGSEIDEAQRREFVRFTDLARKKGIALIGITAPFAPALTQAADRSSQHEIWRQFQKPEFADWIRRQGVIYFNFTNLETFGGKTDEFADPFHPSEPALVRILLRMLREPSFRALFPDMDPGSLEIRLRQATRFEVYRNEF